MGWSLVNHATNKVLTGVVDVGKSFKSMDWAMLKFELEWWLGLDMQRNVMSSFPRSSGGFFS